MIGRKHSCWKLYRKFKTDQLYIKYKSIAQLCTKAINLHIAKVQEKLVSEGKVGDFYKYVNKKLNGSSGTAPLKSSDGQLVYSVADKATVLNKFFASVFTIDNGVIDQSKLPDK